MAIRIASYNLWNGSKETYNRLVDYVKEQHFDVLCLQEVNGWQDGNFAKLNDFMDRAGFTDNEFGNSNSEYKLATLTTLPIISKTVHQEGFWHCVIETHVKFSDKELVIFNVHLDPWKEDPRVKEVERLLNKVDPNKLNIITGDFNSLSQQDNYPPDFLAMLQKQRFYKFGQDALDFRVTDMLTRAGFIDAAAHLGRMDITVPTSYGESDKNTEAVPVSEVPARIDYAFVSSSLASMIKDFQVIKNEETDKISDHFPIVLTLDIESPGQSVAATNETKAPEQPKSELSETTKKLLDMLQPAPGPTSPAIPSTDQASVSTPPVVNTNTEGELIIKHDEDKDT